MVPMHKANIAVHSEFLDHFGVSLSGTYVGEQFAINDTKNETPPIKEYFTLDGKLNFKCKNVKIYAALNNMLNEKYYSFVSKAIGSSSKDHYPAPGRNYLVGVDVEF